jgi:DNA-binding transcriptional regulator YdaS (Cro superfamily)
MMVGMKATKHPSKNKALERAIGRFKSLSDMADQLGVSSYQVIQQWRKAGRVPPDHCTKLAKLTGESREDLVGWPPEDATDRAASSDDAQPPVGDSDKDE